METTNDRRSMFERLIATESDMTATILRIALGVMIFPHGAQKLLGWFGGYGFSGTMAFLTDSQGIPFIFALLAIMTEFFGGIALLLGLLGRPAALGVGVVMIVAAMISHAQFGFFMNWSGAQAGEGFEFHILATAIAAAVAIRGSGALSLDHLIATRGAAPEVPNRSHLAPQG